MAFDAPTKQLAAALRTYVDVDVDQHHHVVDTPIEERAGRLLDHPLIWQMLRQLIYPLLKYHDAVRIADGIAVYDALSPVRPDLCFMANRDAIRAADGLVDIIIPVDWRKEYRTKAKTRETVQCLTRAVKEERAIIVFPSGRLAYMTWDGLRKHPWLSTAVSLAWRYGAPILPLQTDSRNSWLYCALAQISNELRDITVFNELLNKRGAKIGMTFGPPIDPDTLAQDPDLATEQLQAMVENRLLKK
ncbi:MAG: hypothetical protein ACRBM6_15505 [Geminicoccales bacterium]